MRSQDQRYSVIELAENACHVGIPSVAMDDVGIGARSIKIEPLLEAAEYALEFLGAGIGTFVDRVALGSHVGCRDFLIAEAAHVDLD